MPSFDNIPLPEVHLSSQHSLESLSAKFAAHPMSPEAIVELLIYLKREREKVDALAEIEEVLRGRLKERYSKLPNEKRDTLRTDVGIATYSDGPEKVALKDRDWTVENLTAEQLRVSYKPDLKALATILKPDEFLRHVERAPGTPSLTIRESRGSNEYHELDF